MTVLLGTHPKFLEHFCGAYHPERPERLQAVARGISSTGFAERVIEFEPSFAKEEDLSRVHQDSYLSSLYKTCLSGGGRLDSDTSASAESWDAALLAAGAGIEGAERLRRGEASAVFLAVRPPGHHALSSRAMGFCLINNVAVLAGYLRAQGDKVWILDYDAHHGNGTQAIFYSDPGVLYVSLHQHPLYPGSGRVEEVGSGAGTGFTINIPLPAGTGGRTYLQALEEMVAPSVVSFAPDWLLISAGFDAHYRDPLTNMNLVSTDFGEMTKWALQFVPWGRRLVFLEGGYDLDALADSTAVVMSSLLGETYRSERETDFRDGSETVTALAELRARALESSF